MTDDKPQRRVRPTPGYRNPDAGLTDLIHGERALSRPMAGSIRIGDTGLEADTAYSWDIEEGTNVVCSGGQKIGEVVDVVDGHLVVEQGFFIPQDIYVPIGHIADHDDDCLILDMTRDEFEQQDWSHEPEPGTSDGGEETPAT